MSWWNLGGLNPTFKDFQEKHPDATVMGMGWAFYWRFALLVLVIEAVLFFALFAVGMGFGFGHRDGRGGGYGHSTSVPMQGKLNIEVVCNSALAYTTFPDASSTEAFLVECRAGEHPEVIERYKTDRGLGDGAAI